MTESPPSRRTPTWLTATAVVLVLLGAYVGGYYWLGDRVYIPVYGLPRSTLVANATYRDRVFPNAIIAAAYYPMGWIECRVSGERVWIRSIGGFYGGRAFTPP